ncbi:MAG: DUF6320 domain-containing protein [Saccharofermentanales bacterium]
MEIKNIYPTVEKRKLIRQNLMLYSKWSFIFAGLICAVINLFTGGKAWSIVVIWSMWLVWSQLISPDMVEYNRISQTIKFIINSCVLLGLIDIFLAPGWSVKVIVIICFSALILVSVLFFTDFETQRQNMFPMLNFCTLSLLASIVGLVIEQNEDTYWTFVVMGSIAFLLLLAFIVLLGKDFLIEIKKRYSLK